MGSSKAGTLRKPNKAKKNTPPLNPKTKFKNKKRQQPLHPNQKNQHNHQNDEAQASTASASQQLRFFTNEFQSANGLRLSSLEFESIKDKCFLELSREVGGQQVEDLGKHMKTAFGSSWKPLLCEGQTVEGKIGPGNPAVLIISTSALRCLEFLRGVRSLTKECRPVKLFSKHMKVEEQVALLQNRVNFASGTPNRIKKLIDIEALGLARLSMIVLDMHTDVKGYSLLTLPQVRDEFWDLYKRYFHDRLVQGGDVRICLFGPVPKDDELKDKKERVSDE